MDIVKLKTRARSGSGKSYTHKARAQGWIPAVYYGRSRSAKNIEVEANNFIMLVRNRKTRNLIDLTLADEKSDAVAIIKEIQRDILDEKKFLHIDFQHVAMDEEVTVKVPVEITGTAIGVKEQGGVLGRPAKFLNVECLPKNIPEKISVDVSNLKIGDSIHVRDISVPDTVIKDSPDEVIAVVILASIEEEKPIETEVAVEGEGAEGAAAGVAAEAAAGTGDTAGATAGAPSAAGDTKKDAGAAKGSKDGKESKGAKDSKETKRGA
jgi:large subunit ribosomal protein L25